MFCLRYLVVLLIGVSSGFAAMPNIGGDPELYRNFLLSTVNGKATPPLNNFLAENQNVWERSGKFEGDIVLTPEQIQARVDSFSGMRNAILNTAGLWPKKKVYYTVSNTFTSAQKAAIKAALDDISKVSCVRFYKRWFWNPNYINVIGNNSGCYSYIGMTKGAQVLNLEAGCFVHGIIVHEFLHALGFVHMQSTHNRDDWVTINWPKIIPGRENNFVKYTTDQVTNFNVTYDYGSVLHYSQYAFSVDGSPTITPLKPTTLTLGQRVAMSAGDIMKLNMLYSCPGFV